MTTFATTTHLSIMRDAWEPADRFAPHLEIQEVMADYAIFERLMVRVGGPWNWDKRHTHIAENSMWRAAMNAPSTRLYRLKAYNKEVGMCLAVRPRVGQLSRLSGVNPIEIKYFGMFLEETGKGYGGVFLDKLFEALFKRHDEVYLSTRSTNHKKVVPFYQGMGMKIIGQEQIRDDLVLPVFRQTA